MANWEPFLKTAKENETYVYVLVNGEEFSGNIKELYDEVLHFTAYQKTALKQSEERNVFIDMNKIDVVMLMGELS